MREQRIVGRFAPQIATGRPVPRGLAVELVQRDAGQEPPQVAGPSQHVFFIASMYEETAIGRLHDIFGIEPLPQSGAHAAASQGHQAFDITPIERLGRLALAGLVVPQQFAGIRVFGGTVHSRCPSGTRVGDGSITGPKNLRNVWPPAGGNRMYSLEERPMAGCRGSNSCEEKGPTDGLCR